MMTMEQNRLQLHEELCEILGTRHVYFQPPESTKMVYPAIVYSRDNINDTPANNDAYIRKYVYQITIIDKDPTSDLVEKIANLKYCSFERHFTKDNLNHDIFRIFY